MIVGRFSFFIGFALAAALLLAGLLPEAARADDGSVTFNIKSTTQYAVHVRFYARARNVVWPGPDENYPITDSVEHPFNLTCQVGEKVCYGAWYINSGKYWGVGRDGNEGCDDCCLTCGTVSEAVGADYELDE